MYNLQRLLTYFRTQVGFRQVVGECIPKLHPDLLDGAIKVQAVSAAQAFLNDESLWEISPLERHKYNNVLAWDIATPYVVGQRVKYNDGTNEFVYYALQNSLGQTPAFDSDFWETDLSHYLRRLFEDAVKETVSSVATTDLVESHLAAYIAKDAYLNEISMPTLIQFPLDLSLQKKPIFDSVAIRLQSLQYLNLKITHLGLRTEFAETIPFYLYHTSQNAPILQFDITTLANEFQWYEIPIDLDLQYLSANNAKGLFLLGFYQDDLVGNLYQNRIATPFIRAAKRFGAYYTSNENVSNKPNIPQLGEYYTPASIQDYAPFNFKYEVGLDFTDLILRNTRNAAEIIQYSVAAQILINAVNSNRANQKIAHLRDSMSLVLYGQNAVTPVGVKKTQFGLLDELYKKRQLFQNERETLISTSPFTFRF